MNLRALLIACCFAFLSPMGVSAAEMPFDVPDIVVVANPAAGVDKLNRNEVIAIFFGRSRQLPSGIYAIPLDLPATSPEKATFYALLVGKDLAEINAYWARLIFSGRTQPPRQTQDVKEMMALVRENRGAVGYANRLQIDARTKIVFELKQ